MPNLFSRFQVLLQSYTKSGFYGHLAKHKLLGHAKKAIEHKRGNAVNLKSSSSPGQRPTSQKCADDTRLPFSCRFCGRAFASTDSLKKHLRLHKGNKPFRCLDCGKNFASRTGLIRHIRLHTGEKPFPCLTCGRARYLRRHILTHTEVKPYRCKTCESCFSRYDHLKLLSASPQSKTQEDGDMLQCKVCSKRLSTPSDLKRHMSMLHITDKPFPCKRCGKTYSSKKTLMRHNLTIRCKKISRESVPPAKNDVQIEPCRETSKLLQHKTPTEIKGFSCTNCSDRFLLFS
uniref:Zinc finger protein Xfin-like n=1 Tax=Sinocyclocheilus rhinocerous TaxID=307959 RepID=A0A673JI74_9TELE